MRVSSRVSFRRCPISSQIGSPHAESRDKIHRREVRSNAAMETRVECVYNIGPSAFEGPVSMKFSIDALNQRRRSPRCFLPIAAAICLFCVSRRERGRFGSVFSAILRSSGSTRSMRPIATKTTPNLAVAVMLPLYRSQSLCCLRLFCIS